MDDEIRKVIRAERDFLHDISNQLVIAQGMGSIVLKKITESEDIDDKVKSRMAKVIAAVEKITELSKARREALIHISENS